MAIRYKLALLAVTGAFTLGSALSYGAEKAAPHAFSGMFIGIGGGESQFSSSMDFNDSDANVFDSNTGNYSAAVSVEFGVAKLTPRHVYWGLFAFYQHDFDNGADSEIVTDFSVKHYYPQYAIGIMGRVGYVMNNQVLVYAEMGGQMTSLSYQIVDSGDGTMQVSRSPFGFVVGMGVDYAFSSGLRLGIEYRAAPLPEYNESQAFDVTIFPDVNQVSAREVSSLVLVKLSYSFEL